MNVKSGQIGKYSSPSPSTELGYLDGSDMRITKHSMTNSERHPRHCELSASRSRRSGDNHKCAWAKLAFSSLRSPLRLNHTVFLGGKSKLTIRLLFISLFVFSFLLFSRARTTPQNRYVKRTWRDKNVVKLPSRARRPHDNEDHCFWYDQNVCRLAV